MAKNQAVRLESKEPVNIGDRALDNLEFIRETMERSTVFTSVPGFGGILMGVTAIGASYIASIQSDPQAQLSVWLAEAVLAFLIGLLAMWQKSKLGSTSLTSAPARKFALSFIPALAVGVFLTFGLWRFGHFEMMVPTWLLCYGAAVVTGGAFSVRMIPLMGVCFMVLGAVSLFLPAGYGDVMMAFGFGIVHVVFGVVIAIRYGG